VIISCVERLTQIADEVQKERRNFDPVILPGEGDAGLVGSQTSERRLLALQDGFGKAIVLPRLKVE
jgi:hypothetical protein